LSSLMLYVGNSQSINESINFKIHVFVYVESSRSIDQKQP
jgi:hypothetical protein